MAEQVACDVCGHLFAEGEDAWAGDWKVCDAPDWKWRIETRYVCDTCANPPRQSRQHEAPAQHGYGDKSDCLCGRNFATVRGLREHLTKQRARVIPPEPCIAPPGNLCTDTGCWDADRCIVTRDIPSEATA